MELDHLVVTTPDLRSGQTFVETTLGVPLAPGGHHAAFGTMNCLLHLGPRLYLEVIAVDPDAPVPDRARWFGLDTPPRRPSLSHWACRTDHLAGVLSGIDDAPDQVLDLARGAFRWQMAVTGTGRLPFDDRFPAMLEWADGAHPADLLPDRGCRLAALHIVHPLAPALSARLGERLSDQRVQFKTGPAEIVAQIDTPFGPRVLST